ncbi:hypothetical protein KSP39_PZI013286 [Platanthera zijinensis]|uniref:EGF-like domain-containing protein n=1 Tax=Platanthera zijinensis TaxID=2320716 RepID=A0AAP0G3M2_9ASPA
MLPVICFNQGRPALPDVSDTYLDSLLSNFIANGTFDGTQYLLDLEQCIPFQKNLTITSTKDQVSPGIWYIGFFNGLGPERTQSRMINRGHTYTVSATINVEGCASSTIFGPSCNKTIDVISCSQSSNFKQPRTLLDLNLFNRNGLDLKDAGEHLDVSSAVERKIQQQSSLYPTIMGSAAVERKIVAINSNVPLRAEHLVSCTNSLSSCIHNDEELKFYSLDIVGSASKFIISASELMLNQTSISNSSAGFDGIRLMCYVRYSSLPRGSLHDQSADISRTPLLVNSPKIGQWYVALQIMNQEKADKVTQETFSKATLCFSLEWQLHQCQNGKIGQNCTWKSHVLQRVLKSSNVPVEFYYVPEDHRYGSLEDTNFQLDHLLSNSSVDNVTWTYFFLDVPHGAAGSNLHVQLVSEKNAFYEIYSRYGGAASIDNWDFYVNSTSNINGSMILASCDLSKGRINFYILSVREGIWSFGVRRVNDVSEQESYMSISLEGCAKDCSSKGKCHYSVDESGLAFFSYCSCDRNHGGFDCSNELVSPQGHIWHSIFLVASNGAAILPAFWSLRRKAFAEWILFTSSGISSGLYHACDVGSWCALSFHALQFMDFWLSFMAVVSTFVYMAAIDDDSKRAIHTAVAIVTALLAETGATRSENVLIVIAIGTLGLVAGWFLEYSAANRSAWTPSFNFFMIYRWQSIRGWCWNLIKALLKKFRWPFLLFGFIGLALAGTSWVLENNNSYWYWHSLWHISIYTASFFFLCSSRPKINELHPQEPQYELTRQNSPSRE